MKNKNGFRASLENDDGYEFKHLGLALQIEG